MKPVVLLLLTAVLTAQSAPEVEITAEPHHHQILANAQVRVFSVDVAPHTDTLMHWHRHDYIYVMFGQSEVVNAVQGKPPVTINLQDAQVGFTPGPFPHIVQNQDHPFRNVTIELLQDTQLHNSTHKWDETRGLDILQGGTKQVLWVKDAIRATEFELQPGAAIPTQSRAHPLLLVALSDLDLFTNDPRTHGPPAPAPASHHFKSGDCTWLPTGFTRPIVNGAAHVAKFVTLEFP